MEKGYEIKGWDGKSNLHLDTLKEEDFSKIFYLNVSDMDKSNELQLEDNYLYEMGNKFGYSEETMKDIIDNSVERINRLFKDVQVKNGLVAKEPFAMEYFNENMSLQLKKLYPTEIPGIFISKTLIGENMSGDYVYGLDCINGKELEKQLRLQKTVLNLTPDKKEEICTNNIVKA